MKMAEFNSAAVLTAAFIAFALVCNVNTQTYDFTDDYDYYFCVYISHSSLRKLTIPLKRNSALEAPL